MVKATTKKKKWYCKADTRYDWAGFRILEKRISYSKSKLKYLKNYVLFSIYIGFYWKFALCRYVRPNCYDVARRYFKKVEIYYWKTTLQCRKNLDLWFHWTFCGLYWRKYKLLYFTKIIVYYSWNFDFSWRIFTKKLA